MAVRMWLIDGADAEPRLIFEDPGPDPNAVEIGERILLQTQTQGRERLVQALARVLREIEQSREART